MLVGLSALGTLTAQVEWTKRGDGVSARSLPAMVFDAARGVTVLFGGSPATGPADDTWEYDGVVWTRRTPQTVPPARQGAVMVYDSLRQLCVMFGGQGPTAALRDTWAWNGADWLPLASTGPDARVQAAAAYDRARDRVVLFGGTRGGTSQVLLADTWEWDGTQWRQLAPVASPSARFAHAMAYDTQRNAVVLAAGVGLVGGSYTPLDDCLEWDPRTASWVAGARLPGAVRSPAMTFDAGLGGVLLLGTVAGTLPSFLRYDGVTWTPITTVAAPTTAMGFALAFDSRRDRAVVFGGISPLLLLDATWEWDRSDWARVGGGPPGSSGYRMVFDSNLGASLLFSPQSVSTVSRWNGRGWTPVGSAVPGYLFPAYAFDRVRGVTVRYGGLDFARLQSVDETWTFDGSNWQLQAPLNRPSALLGAAMTFDQARGKVLLFGGMVAGRGFSDDTWEWDGSDWAQRAPNTRPAARAFAAMAYDKHRARAVLFGGNGTLRDVWEWDGNDWLAMTPSRVPTAAQLPFITYDEARERVVAFGIGAGSNEHWEWDGVDWQQRTPALLPPPRVDAAIAFDEARQCVVMFGGQMSSTSQLYVDTWELRAQVAAGYADLGAGCATPAVALQSADGRQPWAGEVFTAAATPLPAGTLGVVLAWSASNTQWLGVPLPLDLGPLGAPCVLRVGIDVTLPMTLAAGRASQATLVPATPALLARTLYQQALLLTPGQNALGLVLSSARALRIGTR